MPLPININKININDYKFSKNNTVYKPRKIPGSDVEYAVKYMIACRYWENFFDIGVRVMCVACALSAILFLPVPAIVFFILQIVFCNLSISFYKKYSKLFDLCLEPYHGEKKTTP